MPTPIDKYQPKTRSARTFSIAPNSAGNALKSLTNLLFKNRLLSTIIVILVLIVAASYVNDTYFSPTRSATVIGVGEVTTKAAKATVSFSFIYQGSNRSDTVTTGENQFNSIIAGLNQFNPESVDKNAYQIIDTPTTDIGDTGTLSRGVLPQYVNAAQITTDKPETIQEVVNYLYSAGATTVTQIRYIPENEDRIQKELRQAAVKDAREKARQMASAAGSRLGKVLVIQEDPNSSLSQGSTVTSTETQSPDPLGNLVMTSVVSVTFQLR